MLIDVSKCYAYVLVRWRTPLCELRENWLLPMVDYEAGDFKLFALSHDSLNHKKEKLDAEGNLVHLQPREYRFATDRANDMVTRISAGPCPEVDCYLA